jgi:hypothetical protein
VAFWVLPEHTPTAKARDLFVYQLSVSANSTPERAIWRTRSDRIGFVSFALGFLCYYNKRAHPHMGTTYNNKTILKFLPPSTRRNLLSWAIYF